MILVCIWSNNRLYHASPETLAFVNLFGAVNKDVYLYTLVKDVYILKEICLVFVYDPSIFCSAHSSIFYCFTLLSRERNFAKCSRVQGYVLNLAMYKRKLLNTRVYVFKSIIFPVI